MKSVLIATPCLYGKLDAWYTKSLIESIKLGLKHDILFDYLFLASESILPMARNELIDRAYRANYDCLVFIDDDEEWEPKVLLEIVKSDKEVISVPVINKSDKEIKYNVCVMDKTPDLLDGYIKIEKCGTGFLKISRNVIKDLWESNPECEFRGKKLKYICEYDIINDSFYGEDVILTKKIRELGYKIWLNPKYTVSHIGPKKFTGNFMKSFGL